ncbi:hypothetical protein J6590_053625 [Homalodisca vitripennis]|nr:hypothetical protein J6590_053625 [Homalodisca vitripennis]
MIVQLSHGGEWTLHLSGCEMTLAEDAAFFISILYFTKGMQGNKLATGMRHRYYDALFH